jgi:CBS domain-containing protein
MQVADMMTKNVQCCSPSDPISRAAQIMSDVNCGAVPIVDENNKVVGMLTDRDIVLRVIAKGVDADACTCSDCMTSNVITASPDTDAHECADTMASKQIRRIPVVDREGRLAGIVALGDMATVNIHENEAGQALSQISEPAQPGAH